MTTGANISKRYRSYVLALLFVVCTLNFLDRQIINILAEPIKHQFALKDWQVGVLTGLAFVIFYSVLSIPMARLADRGRRSFVITVSLAVWSLFTVACGFAQGFVQLLLARIMVGVGESGGGPPAQSLITEYTPQNERARAMAIYLIGIPFGSLLGLLIGGLVADRFGWRVAFFTAGVPGIFLAVIAALTLREPPTSLSAESRGDTRSALREMFSKRSFVCLLVGGSLVTFINYGQGAFFPSFFMRSHQQDLLDLAARFNMNVGTHLGAIGVLGVLFGLLTGIAGIISTLAGGRLADHFGAKDLRGYVTVQVLFGSARIPCLLAAMFAPTALLALGALTLQAVASGLAAAAAYAAIPGLVMPRNRATAISIWLFGLNVVGLGLGPLSIGVISDMFALSIGPADGLRWSLICSEIVLAIAMVVLFQARRSFVQDTVS